MYESRGRVHACVSQQQQHRQLSANGVSILNAHDTCVSCISFSPCGVCILILARIARAADETFDSMAAAKPSHVNESSLSEASATPPTIGRSERYVGSE